MLILKQNTAASVPTPAAGKGTIFLSDSDVLSVKNSSGVTESFPTVGGANTQVIFNDSAALSGDANFTFDKDTDILTVTGNVAATRVLTDNLLYANGVAWDLGGDPAGSNTQVQYNNDGEFGAEAAFTYDQATNTLTVDNVAGLLTTGAQTNITSVGTLSALTASGNISAGNVSAIGELSSATLSTTGNAVVGGNLTVNGNLTYVNVDSFAVEDPIISLGGGPNGNALVSNDGKDRGTELQYYSGTAKTAFMGYDNDGAEFIFGKEVSITGEVVTVSTYGNVHGNVFIGDAGGLSNVIASNISGEVANSTHSTTANTVVDAAQPNITSVGTLTSVGAGIASSDFGNSIIVASRDNTTASTGEYIGVVGEATGDVADTALGGVGIAGYGRTNVGTKGTGVIGTALVSATGDTGPAVGVRGIATSTHSGGYNIGLFGQASGSSIDNVALYIKEGDVISENTVVWNLADNGGAALAFDSVGKANILAIETTDGAEGVFASGYLNVTGNITATAGLITDNLYYANGNPWDLQQPAGSNTQVIFNDGGDFGADATFTFDKATDVLSATTVTATTLNGTLGTAAQTAITSVGTLSGLSVTAPISGSITGSAGSATGTAATVTGAAQANITSVGTLTSLAVTGNITSGNVAGTGGVFTYVSGDGANLTSVPGAQITGEVGFADVANSVAGANVSGEVTFAATANAVAGANVSGEVTFAATANAVAGANVSGEVTFAATANAVAGANVSGTVALASVAGTVSGAAQANITSVGTLTGLGVNGTITASAVTANTGLFTGDGGGLSNVAGGNVTGQVANALVSGTVYTAAQPAITSVGTLTSLTTSGNVDVSGNVVTDLIIGKTSGVSITAIGTNQPITLVPTGSGGVSVSSKRILDLAEPTASTDAATKQYVDDVAQGLAVHAPCDVGTTGTLTSITGGTITYNNGAAGVGATLTTSSGNFDTIDGEAFGTGERILVKDETTTANNGIYVKTSSTVLTRADDFNTPTEIAGGDFTFVSTGTTLNDSGFVNTDPVSTVGTDPITFVQFSGAGTYTAGAGLTLTGTEFLITDTAVGAQAYGNGTHNATFTVNSKGQLTNAANVAITANAEVLTGTSLNSSVTGSSLTSVGTISSGTWQGTAVGAAYVSTLNQNTTGYAATVSSAAQPNITSVGTLSALSVTATITGSVSGSAGSVAGADVSGAVAFATTANAVAGANVSGAVSFATTANAVAGANVSGTVSSATSATSATTAGSTTSSATFNNSGSGVASGTTFNGGTARTISYNTIGAPSTTGSGASGTWGINVSGSAASATTAGTVTTAAQPNITSTGTLSALAVSGTTTTGTLQSTTITTGSSSTAGTITGDYTLTAGSTLNATYADLAEKYLADEDLAPGTVVIFGGDAEVQALGVASCSAVAGIVTTNPAQVYNADLVAGEGQFVVELALIGRVPCKVIGPVYKGDLIVSSEMPGFGCAADPDTVKPGTIIGKAITAYDAQDDLTPDGVCEVLVGRC